MRHGERTLTHFLDRLKHALRTSWEAIHRASLGAGTYRWIFLPLGLCAFMLVGVHAAADSMAHRLLQVIDRIDAAFDSLFALTQFTTPAIHWVEAHHRIAASHILAFVWELAADVWIALPCLAYVDRPVSGTQGWLSRLRATAAGPMRPALLFIPASITFGLCASGTLAVLVRGAIQLGLGSWLGATLGRVLAFGVYAAALVLFAGPCVLRVLEYAEHFKGRTRPARMLGAAIVLPLAVVGMFDALSLGALFR